MEVLGEISRDPWTEAFCCLPQDGYLSLDPLEPPYGSNSRYNIDLGN